jgi:hypothetical protein
MGNREPTFCDRAIPDFMAPLARSVVIAAGLLKELSQPSVNIHRPLCRGGLNLSGFNESNFDFLAGLSETVQLDHLSSLRLDFREQRIESRRFGRHRQFVVYRAPVVAFGAPVGANLKDPFSHRSHQIRSTPTQTVRALNGVIR